MIHAALPVLAAPAATASEPARDPACRGVHGLWAPLPDACLDVIDTDRPHQTDTPHVVPAGHTQVESAVAAVQLGSVTGGSSTNARVVLLEDSYKFGVVSRTEFELHVAHASYVPAARHFDPPGPVGVRMKLNFVEGEGWIPAVTLVPWLFVPVAPSQPLRGGPYLFWGWDLPARFELEMNAGVLFGQTPAQASALVLASALTYTFGTATPVRAFVDIYAIGSDVQFGTGVLWAFAHDMQLDLGTYVGVAGDEPAVTPFLGFSLRR